MLRSRGDLSSVVVCSWDRLNCSGWDRGNGGAGGRPSVRSGRLRMPAATSVSPKQPSISKSKPAKGA